MTIEDANSQLTTISFLNIKVTLGGGIPKDEQTKRSSWSENTSSLAGLSQGPSVNSTISGTAGKKTVN